ncbi:MAG TPA: FAD-dependent monooxygenase [Micromonosporaceae bacterium]|nr:FAD-dependent monooxygenase [Micromonosporaceae bacterium]
MDVLVVGAGPTGLCLASQLQAYGTPFRIIDRHLDRAHESRALAVQPRTLEVLAPLGVAEAMVRNGNPAVRAQMHFGDRVVSIPLFDIGADDTPYPYLLFLSQAETERILDEHLTAGGTTVERGTELVDYTAQDGGLTCTLRHGDGRTEQVQARYIAGCDGAHSTVRNLAGIPFAGRAYPQTFVLADLNAAGVEAGAVHSFISGEGMLFLFPLGQPAPWRVLAMRGRADPTPAEDPVSLADVQALCDRYTHGLVRLDSPVWMTNFRLHNRGATHHRAGPAFLAGDAAHIHSPAGAQGMNTGIQDAINLGWKLALVCAGAAPGLLDTYEPERGPVGRLVLRTTDRLFTFATSTNGVLRFVRTSVVPHLARLAIRARKLRGYAFRVIAELALQYRSSPASTEGPRAPRRGPRAGDRLPDAPVTSDGTTSTLHEMVAAPGFHLLLCGPDSAWPDGVPADIAGRYPRFLTVHRVSAVGAPARLVSDRPMQYLVRPDGYLGYRAGGTDLAGLHSYLDRWLGPETRREGA